MNASPGNDSSSYATVSALHSHARHYVPVHTSIPSLDPSTLLATMDVVEHETDESDPMELLHVTHRDGCETFTRHRLQETLMLMGCRPKDAWIVTKEVFHVYHKHSATASDRTTHDEDKATTAPSSSTALSWHVLYQCIYSSLTRLDYIKPHHLLPLKVAKEITQRNQSFAVLLGGTSGTGKSTLASLLAARLRLTTVLPTDSVRHVLRSFTVKEAHPSVFVSTYQAGDALAPEDIAALHGDRDEMSSARLHQKKVLKGYKLQSHLVLDKLDRVLTMFEARRQSLVVEGVHLNTAELLALVQKHPTCVPFVIYISHETKHRERFAVRARHMTIDPQENKYIKHFDNIRIIQRHLCKHADRFLIPKINNTNVDRSIATIQSTLIRVLRKLDRGDELVDAKLNKFVTLSREHENATKKGWSSKGVRKAMRPLLKQKVSKRLLLRRLLAEQTTNRFGVRDPHTGEDTSSSDEEEDDASREADDEANAEDDDEDETTVVGSLLSGTATHTHDHSFPTRRVASVTTQGHASVMRSAGAKQKPVDDREIDTSELSKLDEVKDSLAVRQAAGWPASPPLTPSTDWDAQLPLPSREVTFAKVVATFAESANGKGVLWPLDERRKSWMAGDALADVSKAHASRSRTPPPRASRHCHAFFESQRVEGEAQLQLQRTQHQLQQHQVVPMDHPLPPRGKHTKTLARRVHSLPVVQHQDSTSSLDFDFDSVSMADANEATDRVSQTSSPRDECISPLEHSYDETESHFEGSSQSSVEET